VLGLVEEGASHECPLDTDRIGSPVAIKTPDERTLKLWEVSLPKNSAQ
jgi:hypothetical protein